MSPKHTLYSILELATVNSDSNPAEAFRRAADLAAKAEDMGYHRFWLAEHHNMVSIGSSATAVLIGYVAQHTKRIRVGSGGIMLPNHSPLIVAEQFGTLGSLYPDRIDLGLGRAPGTDQVTAHAIRSDRMQAVFAFPDEVKKIQEYFSPKNSTALVRAPVAEGIDVPMYILGSSTDSAYLASELGLPYAFASHFAPAQLIRALDMYRNNFKPSAQLNKPYVMAGINVVADDTDEEARRLATSVIQMQVGAMSGRIDYMHPPVEPTEEMWQLMEDPSYYRMFKYAFIGSKETVNQKTKAFLEETQADELIVVSHIYNHDARVRSFEIFSEVMKEMA